MDTCTNVTEFGDPVSRYSFNISLSGFSNSLDCLPGYLEMVSYKAHGPASSLGWLAPAATSMLPLLVLGLLLTRPVFLIKGICGIQTKHMVFAQNLTVFIYVLNNLFFLLLQNSACLFGKSRQAKIKYKPFINPQAKKITVSFWL